MERAGHLIEIEQFREGTVRQVIAGQGKDIDLPETVADIRYLNRSGSLNLLARISRTDSFDADRILSLGYGDDLIGSIVPYLWGFLRGLARYKAQK